MEPKKITELSLITTPNLTGLTVVVDSGTTYNTSLESLSNALDNRDHTFTGNQTIEGNLTVNGQIINAGEIPSITYAELLNLIDISGLTQFSYYLLTDFTTTYWMYDGRGNECNGGVPAVGDIEPLILFATSSDVIDHKAYSLIYHDDEIRYEWNYNLVSDDDAFLNVPNFKGVILNRTEGIYGNSAGWDIRTIKYRRWESTGPVWNSGTTYNLNDISLYDQRIWKSMTTNINRVPSAPSSTSDWVMMINLSDNLYWNSNATGITFGGVTIPSGSGYYDFDTMSLDTSLSYNNTINNSKATISGQINTRLLNIVLFGYSHDVHIEDSSYVLTIGSDCYDIDVRHGCYYVILGRYNKNILLRTSSYGHIFSEGVVDIEVGANTNSCLFGYYSNDIKLLENSSVITFGVSCRSIIIGSYCNSIFLDSRCNKITMGTGSHDIKIKSDCSIITMSESCVNIEIGSISRSLIFENSCFDILIPAMSAFVKFGCHSKGDLTGLSSYLTGTYHPRVITNSIDENYLTYYDATNVSQFIPIPLI